MATKKKSTNGDPENPPVPVRRRCGAMQVYHRLLETSPNYRANQHALEHATVHRQASGVMRRTAGPVVIPVVVHVVFHDEAGHVSPARVRSQIDVLNEDFSAKNADRKKVPDAWKGIIEDAGIQFELATKDPRGGKTNGILSVKTSTAGFSDADDGVKFEKTGGSDAWPTDKYLNIWACSLGGGLLGYAQFPGGPPKTDGVVILNNAFGRKKGAISPYDLGRSCTHEVGHWLNLRHIWGDTPDCSGSDSVNDTPNAAGPNYGKPKYPSISCANGPNGDMFMNFMDYVDDDSMHMFTPQQIVRMHAALDGARQSIGG